MAWERKRIEEEIYARIEAEQEPIEQVRARILKQLDAIEAHDAEGGAPADGGDRGGTGPETPRDSVCKSWTLNRSLAQPFGGTPTCLAARRALSIINKAVPRKISPTTIMP